MAARYTDTLYVLNLTISVNYIPPSPVSSSRERQDRLDRMREKIGSLMKEKEDDEDMRIKKAQREMEGKQERELAEKLAKQNKALDMIAQHRVKEVGYPTLHTMS